MENLNLKKVKAYTVYSSDSEIQSSEKGIYADYDIASKKSTKSGWYGSNGEVREKDNIYEDENGELYSVKYIGKFTDVEQKHKDKAMASIKNKLTKEELELLGIK